CVRLPVPRARAAPGVRGVRDVVQGRGLRGAPPGVGVRGRGRPRAGRAVEPGRHRFPHHARGAPRGAGALRGAGDQPDAGGPVLLPPGHGAVRAGRRERGVLPGGVLARQPRGAGPAVPGRGARHPRGRDGLRPELRLGRSPRVHLARGDGPRGPARRPRLRSRPRRPVGVPQGRRRHQVLHSGDPLMTTAARTRSSADLIGAEEPVLAHNYHPLPVVVARAEGTWVEDVEGRRYLDMLAGYSALNFGHRHPGLIEAAHRQLDRLTLTSRAFHNDRLAEFAERLTALTGLDMVLPRNTGAEAVESAVKVARKWAYDVKGVPADRATIVVAADNFHGRTTTIVSFSTDEVARRGFGPFTPGFRVVPYND